MKKPLRLMEFSEESYLYFYEGVCVNKIISTEVPPLSQTQKKQSKYEGAKEHCL
jgi:hypothetical protein